MVWSHARVAGCEGPSSKSSSDLTAAATFVAPLAVAVSSLAAFQEGGFSRSLEPSPRVADGGLSSLTMQHGGVAPSFGMAPPPGMAAAAADDGRFCLPWAAAAHFENWGDSGIVATSPLAETTCTDAGGDRHQAQTVC